MILAGFERSLTDQLGLRSRPVALTFRDVAPAGVSRVEKPAPAGCGYWRLAAEGKVFFTEAEDHFNCPIGAHTHGVEVPPDKVRELEATVGVMVQLEYIKMEEVPAIPRMKTPFKLAVYAPLSESPCEPDVVLVRGTAKQVMLLGEAAQSAIGRDDLTMGRPTCAAVPAAVQSGGGVRSFGCIGNRVYTGLGDEELYYAVPGPRLREVVDKLGTILRANHELENHHRARCES